MLVVLLVGRHPKLWIVWKMQIRTTSSSAVAAVGGGSWTTNYNDTQIKYAEQRPLGHHRSRCRLRRSGRNCVLPGHDSSRWDLCVGRPQREIPTQLPLLQSGPQTTKSTGSPGVLVTTVTSLSPSSQRAKVRKDWLNFILITALFVAASITPPGVCGDDSSQDFQKNSRCQRLFCNFHTHYAK